jgi:hypothetical protein
MESKELITASRGLMTPASPLPSGVKRFLLRPRIYLLALVKGSIITFAGTLKLSFFDFIKSVAVKKDLSRIFHFLSYSIATSGRIELSE